MGYDGTSVLEYLGRTHQTALLTDREKQLIGLAVTITRGCQVCTRGRIEKARQCGIGDDVLNALVGVVAGHIAVSQPSARRVQTLPAMGRFGNSGFSCACHLQSAWPAPRKLIHML
jgi:hypothetical protein